MNNGQCANAFMVEVGRTIHVNRHLKSCTLYLQMNYLTLKCFYIVQLLANELFNFLNVTMSKVEGSGVVVTSKQ